MFSWCKGTQHCAKRNRLKIWVKQYEKNFF